MYLNCTSNEIPTGFYTLREQKNNYNVQSRFSKVSIQWLQCISQGRDIHIRHSPLGELRIENFKVDGIYDKTIFEFYGCKFHGHNCGINYNYKLWQKKLQREKDLKELGYQIVSITECEWR